MGTIKNEYKSFLEDIEKNIKNKEDLNYIKKRFATFADIMLEQMDNIIQYKEEQIENIENEQKQIREKMTKMQSIIDNIEKDIYAEEGFDFEIVCPYCNNEFIIDVDENKTEIQCPECNNTIELDWSGDIDDSEHSDCGGNCRGCHGCEETEDDDM